MRSLVITGFVALTLAACASQTPAPAQPVAAPAPAAAAPVVAVKAPQCWNGDAAKFEDVGVKASISGIMVICQKTADGKSAQWMGMK
jgi:putative hemolysin